MIEFMPLVGIIFIILILIRNRKTRKMQRQWEEKLRESGILEVDMMNGKVFEEFLRALLITKGYKVSLTKGSGDYGADLTLTTNNKKIVVQAKRYNKKVGLKAVQEIVSAKSYYGANECWVITNNYYTTPARNLGESNNVILIDRDQLMNWMIEAKKQVK
ncbi:MAG: restriction endonuclease [Psychrobacillus psychrotolerans]|uniref:restriction endonuclease n=1 Tax=Psychrobacillus psychrotolerans TaxID=126156 RepID=UPI003BAE60A2